MTKASGVYMRELVFLIVACIGMLSSKMPGPVRKASGHLYIYNALGQERTSTTDARNSSHLRTQHLHSIY